MSLNYYVTQSVIIRAEQRGHEPHSHEHSVNEQTNIMNAIEKGMLLMIISSLPAKTSDWKIVLTRNDVLTAV